MGEKPLSIDETFVPTTATGGVPPLGGGDTPPPGMAAGSILTTRSNIKSGGAAPVVDGSGGTSLDDDSPPDKSNAGSIITTRANIKGAVGGMDGDEGADAGDATPADAGAGGGTTDDPPPPDMSNAGGIITTRSNIKRASGGMAAHEGADAGDATSTETGPAGIAIKEQGVKYGEAGGDATPAGDAPGVAGGSQPIPGVDIIIKSHPTR